MTDLLYAEFNRLIEFYTPNGLLWLALVASISGLVRGFSGFGTAMVYLPFAGSIMPPIWALTSMVVMDLIGPVMLVPRTIRNCNLGELVRLAVGALLAMPFGVLLLLLLQPDSFRYAVSIVTLLLLILLIAGVRYRGKLSGTMIYGAGGLGGFFGGCVGLPGPPVIMLYLASTLPAVAIRANLFVYLVIADAMILALFGIQDLLDLGAVVTGLGVAVPYLLALSVGSMLFRPSQERTYRIAAYCIIAVSALMGLPILD